MTQKDNAPKIKYGLFFADETDAPYIAETEKSCFSEPWSENAVTEEIKAENSIFIVCRSEENKTVGYISGRDNSGEFYINNVAVSSDFRKMGIGEALVRRLIDEVKSRGCEFATLEVRESNGGARKLYEKCGFNEVGVRRSFYRAPTENAVLYTIFFNDPEFQK